MLPLSLGMLTTTDKKSLNYIEHFFILCALISSGWSFLQYLQNIESYTKLYAQGAVIPTLIHHVSLAVLVAIAALMTLNNLLKENAAFEKTINGILILWFIYFIHILSVRTGLVLLYAGIFLFAIIVLMQHKKKMFALGLTALMLLSAYISYEKIPTIKSKIAYTLYGISQYKNQQDTANQVSDSRRILSDRIGWNLLQQNKCFGVGIGDIQDEMNVVYQHQYPQFKKEVYAHIHNQYLYTACGVGLLSGLLFCVLVFLPFIQYVRERKPVFAIAYLMLLLVMCWEPFVENQLGTSIFLLLCSWAHISKKEA